MMLGFGFNGFFKERLLNRYARWEYVYMETMFLKTRNGYERRMVRKNLRKK